MIINNPIATFNTISKAGGLGLSEQEMHLPFFSSAVDQWYAPTVRITQSYGVVNYETFLASTHLSPSTMQG